MSETVPDFGCGDGGCVFHVKPRYGVHTNGGCSCLKDLLPTTTFADRLELRQQISRALTAAYLRGYDAGMKK